MVNPKEIKITVEPSTLKGLYENEVIDVDQAKKGLKEFTKDELIEAFLETYSLDELDIEDEDDDDEGEAIGPEVIPNKKVVKKDEIDLDDDFDDLD